MEKSLTKQDLKFINESIQLLDSWRRKIFSISTMAITGMILLMILLNESTELIIIIVILEIILTYFIWFVVFGKPSLRLKKDAERGVKIVQSATIQKLKIIKGQKSYFLSNGIKISEDDIDRDNLELNSINVGQKLTVTYTPYYKMVINVKINDKIST